MHRWRHLKKKFAINVVSKPCLFASRGDYIYGPLHFIGANASVCPAVKAWPARLTQTEFCTIMAQFTDWGWYRRSARPLDFSPCLNKPHSWDSKAFDVLALYGKLKL